MTTGGALAGVATFGRRLISTVLPLHGFLGDRLIA
jgi:hypothetical protein